MQRGVCSGPASLSAQRARTGEESQRSPDPGAAAAQPCSVSPTLLCSFLPLVPLPGRKPGGGSLAPRPHNYRPRKSFCGSALRSRQPLRPGAGEFVRRTSPRKPGGFSEAETGPRRGVGEGHAAWLSGHQGDPLSPPIPAFAGARLRPAACPACALSLSPVVGRAQK